MRQRTYLCAPELFLFCRSSQERYVCERDEKETSDNPTVLLLTCQSDHRILLLFLLKSNRILEYNKTTARTKCLVFLLVFFIECVHKGLGLFNRCHGFTITHYFVFSNWKDYPQSRSQNRWVPLEESGWIVALSFDEQKDPSLRSFSTCIGAFQGRSHLRKYRGVADDVRKSTILPVESAHLSWAVFTCGGLQHYSYNIRISVAIK